ncbi:MAG: hypothetical protein WCB04_05240, partial [Mycobacteriales bacterium]
VDGALVARGSCAGTVVATTTRCDDPTPDPAGNDPSYPPPTNPLVYRAVPACGAAATVTFAPGYYDDAAALTALTSGGCRKTMHFPAGVYFFDFHNGAGAPLPNGPHVWTVDDAKTEVVGGTPKDWSPAGGNPPIPGSCVSPLDASSNGGVQFVFGGDSRLDVKRGRVELCGQYSAGRPPIAIYGMKNGADPGSSGPVTGKTDGTGTSTGPEFASPERVTEADSFSSDADITAGAAPVTSQLALQGFTPPVLPAGSILTKAELVVRHREQSATDSMLQRLEVTLTPTRSAAATINSPVPRYTDGFGGGEFHEDTIDVTAALADEVHGHGLNGLQVTYAATVAAGQSVTERLDSVQLMLTWTPPAVRGETESVDGGSNCVATAGSGGCALIKARPGNPSPTSTDFYIQGTVYAPAALVDVQLEGVTAPVIAVGIVVRALKIALTADPAYASSPTISVPDPAAGGAPRPLEVYFRAYTCPGGQRAGCTPSDTPSGTAWARYQDPDIFAPTPPYDDVTVLAWAIRTT